MDGTPAGYYFSPGSDPNMFVVYMEARPQRFQLASGRFLHTLNPDAVPLSRPALPLARAATGAGTSPAARRGAAPRTLRAAARAGSP
jgi:hypothetical protein